MLSSRVRHSVASAHGSSESPSRPRVATAAVADWPLSMNIEAASFFSNPFHFGEPFAASPQHPYPNAFPMPAHMSVFDSPAAFASSLATATAPMSCPPRETNINMHSHLSPLRHHSLPQFSADFELGANTQRAATLPPAALLLPSLPSVSTNTPASVVASSTALLGSDISPSPLFSVGSHSHTNHNNNNRDRFLVPSTPTPNPSLLSISTSEVDAVCAWLSSIVGRESTPTPHHLHELHEVTKVLLLASRAVRVLTPATPLTPWTSYEAAYATSSLQERTCPLHAHTRANGLPHTESFFTPPPPITRPIPSSASLVASRSSTTTIHKPNKKRNTLEESVIEAPSAVASVFPPSPLQLPPLFHFPTSPATPSRLARHQHASHEQECESDTTEIEPEATIAHPAAANNWEAHANSFSEVMAATVAQTLPSPPHMHMYHENQAQEQEINAEASAANTDPATAVSHTWLRNRTRGRRALHSGKTRLRRSTKHTGPEPCRWQYPSDAAFHSAWVLWRQVRDTNNRAVQRSRQSKKQQQNLEASPVAFGPAGSGSLWAQP
eukprot:m.117162 g.117162  ORF g.117162 m.117162 type:complete len:554 (-) comp14482_c0_seq1:32-1693(-)